jgi:hypothetical protein
MSSFRWCIDPSPSESLLIAKGFMVFMCFIEP